MWRTAVLVAASACAAGVNAAEGFEPLLGYATDAIDPVELQLESELYEMEHEVPHHPGHHRVHHSTQFLHLSSKHKGHLGHRRKQFLRSTGKREGHHHGPLQGHHRKPFLSMLSSDVDIDEEQPLGDQSAELSSHHHLDATQKERGTQDGESTVVHATSHLEDEVNKAIEHTNRVVAIKSALQNTELQILSDERKVRKLEADSKQLDMAHQSLSNSLRKIMDPKVASAQKRLEKRGAMLVKMQDLEDQWKAKENEYHTSSLAMLEERSKRKASVEAAREAVERAHQEWKGAEKLYATAKKNAGISIEEYRYSKSKAMASASREKRGEERTKQAEDAVEHLRNMLKTEQERVDASTAHRQEKIRNKIAELEDAEKNFKDKLAELKRSYAVWQKESASWASKLAPTHDSPSAALDQQDKMRTSSEHQVAFDDELSSDWDAWDKSASDSEAATEVASESESDLPVPA